MSKLADCRKFSPNVFNKNKCASCFKAKEEHSEEALENNRASRKVAKCGYLFAAPDWDFSNPINRTKRWQRRWFVLYDDGELTYSVDEHPETVPQAIIDMNRVVEVSEAEEVTGHPFSLALTAADRVHFLKGTSREESKWWFDVLSMFPRTNMKTGRHKRNATFPGSKATTIIAPPPVQQQSTAPNSPCLGKGAGMQPFATPPMSRPRFHSHTESLVRGGVTAATTSTTTAASSAASNRALPSLHLLPPVKDTSGRNATTAAHNNNNNNNSNSKALAIDEDDTIPVKEAPALSSTPAVGQQTAQKPALVTKELLIADKDYDDKLKKRVIRREIRGARSARCNSEILTSMILPPSGSNMSSNNNNNNSSSSTNNKGYALVLPSSTLTAPIGSQQKAERPRSALLPPAHPPATPAPRSPAAGQTAPHSPFYLYMADVPRNRHFESLDSLQHAFTSISSTSRARHCSSKDAADGPATAKAETGNKERPLSMHELGRSYDAQKAAPAPSCASPAPKAEKPPKEAVRGDPDGCGLDPVTSFCSPLPDRRTPALTSVSSSLLADDCLKKGWLLRLIGGEWKKCWFVLRASGTLTIYRDRASEDAGIGDDALDLTQMTSVDETDAGRSYGFQIATCDGKKRSIAALTSGIRAQWIQALRNACNEKMSNSASTPLSSASSVSSASTLKAEKENVDPQLERDRESLDSFESDSQSSDDDGVDDDDDDDDDDEDDAVGDSADDDEDAVRESHASGLQDVLPPSPPLNRNPMSRVKERDRSRSSSRSRSRQRSGSPASSVRTASPAPRVVTPVIQSDVRSSSPSLGISASLAQVRLDAAKSEITRLLNERREHERDAKQQVANLTARLAEKEHQVNRLASQLDAVKQENNRQISEIRKLLETREAELKALRDESASCRTENLELRDNLKRERSEVYKLRDVAAELRSLLESRNDTLNQLQSKTDEVEQLNRRLKATQDNLSQTQERLQRGIDENEGLFARLRQMEESRTVGAVGGPLRRSRSSTGSVPLQLQLCNRNLLNASGSKKSLHRLDSLSDLSNIDYELDLDALDRDTLADEYVELRTRFERSLVEIRALKRELRQTQSALDGYEVAQVALKQQWQAKEADYTSQLNLMAARVQDLTAKMAAADKQVRQLKLKVAKSESREKRRTQSLKGRESFQLSKEVEDKLVELEHKMAALSSGATPEREGTPTRSKKGFEETTKSFRMRRKSLEGGVADPMKILLRVDQLEQQVAGRQATGRKTPDRKLSPPSKSLQGKPPRSSPLKSPGTKRIAETDEVPKSSKIVQDLEQCIVELELIFSNKSTSEGVVSKIRAVQQELLDPDRSKSACASDGIEKIQELLRTRLSELKVKRDHERSVGRLDSAALSQIAAEKLALELAIAEQLAAVSSSEQPEKRENLRDAHWTVQKLGWLKRKLNGEKSVPALEQSTCFGTYCAALAERLSAVAAVSSSIRAQTAPEGSEGITGRTSLPPRVAQHLADEERELSQVFGKYKEDKIKELAVLLAHETLRMGDSAITDNQLVEEVKVRQAWLEAQEIANKELVDSDIRQALTRMAEVFAEDVGVEERLASALLLWPVQQLQYEQRCQVVEEVLRSEMEEAVMLLSNAYERSLKELKANGGAVYTPEVDLEAAISEFAEMVAHKALVDGHIAILQGEGASQPLAAISGADSNVPANIGVIQETEEIIGPICSMDFFPNALHCGEVAAILHRNLVEPRKAEDAGSLREDRSGSSSTVNEDFIRQKYQAEIEHLRALTEKGMSAMEGSHKRIIAQLEEKHHQEIARLQEEKERALAEETQATLAALDAMRKAHEAEVQREISRFKEEFLNQMAARQAPVQPESPNRQHEMEEIRREILSLSEKYSHKCLESAALEQKVSTLGQQVNVFQRQIADLDARNQQLRAFLDAGPGSIPQDSDPVQLIRAKDGQLIMLQEDIAELQFCLRESQTREEELASLARNLGQYLRTERPLSADEVASLRHRLEDLLLLSGPASGGGTPSPKSPTVVAGTARKSLLMDDKTRDSPPRDATSRFHYVRSKDLTRSPSCPRLSGFLSLAPRLSTRPVPLTPRDPTATPGTTHH